MNPCEEWYLATPEELDIQRIDLTLGLRSSIRYYNDLVAPGIGNVSFIRQIMWSLIAVKYSKKFKVSGIKLSNAIEALGLKAFYNVNRATYREKGYRGTRAFERSTLEEINSYKELCQPRNYVQITYRQNTTRSLPQQTGLGVVDGNTSFEGFNLSPAGLEMLSAYEAEYYQPSTELILHNWIQENKRIGTSSLSERFGPISSQVEREKMLLRITADVSPMVAGLRNDTGRRRKLASVFKNLKPEWDIQDLRHELKNFDMSLFEEDLQKAIDFFEMLLAGKKLLVAIYSRITDRSTKLSLQTTDLKSEIDFLIASCKRYILHKNNLPEFEAAQFANTVISFAQQPAKILYEVASRDMRVCMPVEGHITQGPLYRNDISVPEIEDIDEVPKSIRNLYSVWKESNEKR